MAKVKRINPPQGQSQKICPTGQDVFPALFLGLVIESCTGDLLIKSDHIT